MAVMDGRPSVLLEVVRERLAPPARVVDLACGRGRNALALAAWGYRVDAVDRDVDALAELARAARKRALPVRPLALDLTAYPLAEALGGRYDAVLCIRYLDRALWPALEGLVRPGGIVVVETYTEEYRERRPTFPQAYTLRRGELLRSFVELRPVFYREVVAEGTEGLVAVRRGAAESASPPRLVSREA